MFIFLLFFQIRDFILIFCSRIANQVIGLLRRVMQLLLGFDAYQYIQCMLLDQLHIEYLCMFNYPAWKQLNGATQAFNEERSKMSLLLLAFSVAMDSNKHIFAKLDTNYSIINYCCMLIKEFYEEFNILLPASTPLSSSLGFVVQQGIITSVLHTIQ